MNKLRIMAVALASTMATAATGAPPLLKGPVPTAPIQGWITTSDFPAETLQSATVVGPANFALTVSEKGRVIRCTVERSSGSAKLDETACYIFEQRGRFHAAVDSLGKPALGVYRVDAIWAVSGQTATPAVPLVEMAVALQKMPQPLSDPAYVDIAVSVDEAGRVDGCAPAEALNWAGQPIADRQEAGKVLGGVPCAEALKSLKLEAAKTEKGKPVRSVQTATMLFTANVPALIASAAPAGLKQDTQPGSTPAPPAPPVGSNEILVEGRNITGLIIRPEVQVPPVRGFNPFVDFAPVGYEAILLLAANGQWYRATLEPPCIGDSNMIATDPDNTPGVYVIQHPDGSVDYRSTVLVQGDDLPAVLYGDGKCRMISLVESKPPRGWKKSSRPITPPPPILAARGPDKAPDGGPIYPVVWQERPTPAQYTKIAAGWSGSGWILCQTAADYRVRNCRTVSESPRLTGVANRMKLESGRFRVRPPIVDGRPAIGAWVAIGFDFSAKRKEPVPCNPSDPRDPC